MQTNESFNKLSGELDAVRGHLVPLHCRSAKRRLCEKTPIQKDGRMENTNPKKKASARKKNISA